MTTAEGQTSLFAKIARRFPLLPRSRPPAQRLQRRVNEVGEIAQSARRERDENRATRASEALNKAALIASDCGLADLARDLCWRQFDIFHSAAPFAGQAAKMALQPLVNLGRLATHGSDGNRAYAIFHSIYDAVTNQATCNIDGREVDFNNLVADSEQRQELRRFAWTVLLADGTRALTQAGRWSDAVQNLQRYRGIGKRLLDGRQAAILHRTSEGDCDAAIDMIKESVTPEPWEYAVATCLHTLCLQLGNNRAEAEAMIGAYLRLQPQPEHQVFRTRLGLCVIDLVAGVNHASVPRVIQRVNQEAVATVDARLAWDVLTHELCQSALSQHGLNTLVETVESSGLRSGTMPPHLLDALVASVKVGEDQLSDALARDAYHVRGVPR